MRTALNDKMRNIAGILAIICLLLLPSGISALAITSATITITADDSFTAYIDGTLVYDTGIISSGQPWNIVYTLDLLNPVNYLTRCGDNVLAINYYDTMGTQTRISYKMEINYDNGDTVVVYSDGNSDTRQMMNGYSPSQTFPAGWNTVGFDDSSWTDTLYMCDATGDTYNSIADASFPTGWVPYIGYNDGCWLRTGDVFPSNLIRQKFVLPCPNVNITKSINSNVFYLGDTVTYCFYITNTDTASATFNLWDTLPPEITFIGCDHGCATYNYGPDVVVAWEPLTVDPGNSLEVCTWAVVSSYQSYIPVWDRIVFGPLIYGKNENM